jgi:hypothetical protein
MNEYWQKVQNKKLDQKIHDLVPLLNRKDKIIFLAYLICLYFLDRFEFYLSRFWSVGWIVGRPLKNEHRQILGAVYDLIGWFFRHI